MAVAAAKMGEMKTHMLRTWIVKWSMFRILWNMYDVPIMPGYAVPPTIRPRGYQERSSIQLRNS